MTQWNKIVWRISKTRARAPSPFLLETLFFGIFGSHVCVWILPCQKEAHRKKKPNKPIFLDQNKVILYIKRVGPGIDSESGMIVAKYFSEVVRDEMGSEVMVRVWEWRNQTRNTWKLDRRPADVYTRNLQASLRVVGINKKTQGRACPFDVTRTEPSDVTERGGSTLVVKHRFVCSKVNHR